MNKLRAREKTLALRSLISARHCHRRRRPPGTLDGPHLEDPSVKQRIVRRPPRPGTRWSGTDAASRSPKNLRPSPPIRSLRGPSRGRTASAEPWRRRYAPRRNRTCGPRSDSGVLRQPLLLPQPSKNQGRPPELGRASCQRMVFKNPVFLAELGQAFDQSVDRPLGQKPVFESQRGQNWMAGFSPFYCDPAA
jgi:hypothetical protein